MCVNNTGDQTSWDVSLGRQADEFILKKLNSSILCPRLSCLREKHVVLLI